MGGRSSSLDRKYTYHGSNPHGTTERTASSGNLNIVRHRGCGNSLKFKFLPKKIQSHCKRRHSRNFDHAKLLRELVSTWNTHEMRRLHEYYEALAALKDLAIQADLARPLASNLANDLGNLLARGQCSDLELIVENTSFLVHRTILICRCRYFRELLIRPIHTQTSVHVGWDGLEPSGFRGVLRYLYTGELVGVDPQLLVRMGCSVMTVEEDFRRLLDTMEMADALLLFSEGQSGAGVDGGCSSQGEYGFPAQSLELSCHRVILAARSPFFRGLLQRRQRTERTPTKIVLDDTVIPSRYANVLLSALYLDCADIASLPGDKLTHAMELYQIARLLDFDILAQGCEDAIFQSLCISNLSDILEWSEQPHGSIWVNRQALHFFSEHFSPIALSLDLFCLQQHHLATVLSSDFLQASEYEVLQAVLCWGEQQVSRRLDDKEPNVISNTAHAVARKGARRKEEIDMELRSVLCELIPLVRTPLVLPSNNDFLTSAIRRGLIHTRSAPQPHQCDLKEAHQVKASVSSSSQSITKLPPPTPQAFMDALPRLFPPYNDQLKLLLMCEGDCIRSSHHMRHRHESNPMLGFASGSLQSHSSGNVTADIVAAAIPIPDPKLMQAMLKREFELRRSSLAAKAYALAPFTEVTRYLRLRIVREFGFPDGVVQILNNAARPDECCNSDNDSHHNDIPDIAMATAQLHLTECNLDKVSNRKLNPHLSGSVPLLL